ncbi:MAG TPA: phosphate ABC transporter ATP-binding protein PstB [Candidatus Limnocylindrales bacterium]|nr:phosphate ABC transporter ATP-binding protein PstB [Candidatus Limnocylindrales bacterium]
MAPDRVAPQTKEGPPAEGESGPAILVADRLSLWYAAQPALTDVTLKVQPHRITAIIGPSGCGKSSLLRCFNRMNDLYPPVRYDGAAHFHGENILRPDTNLVELRRRVGMVFQRANPFPMSIFQNVAYGPRLQGIGSKGRLEEIVESALQRSALWQEVKDRLNRPALGLSGGQQQRLCIARALAVEPEVLLLDEPASALDPTATAKIEELILEIKSTVTVAIVTHNMQQAARTSDYTAFMLNGKLIEEGPTRALFTSPRERLTEDYITGRFG